MDFKPGINHIELWVSNLAASKTFYGKLFELIGWSKLYEDTWSCGHLEIYLREEKAASRALSLGVHHICLQATNRDVVDKVTVWLNSIDAVIFNGPKEMESYSEGYYTVDFYDPDGFILEVAHTPNMKM